MLVGPPAKDACVPYHQLPVLSDTTGTASPPMRAVPHSRPALRPQQRTPTCTGLPDGELGAAEQRS